MPRFLHLIFAILVGLSGIAPPLAAQSSDESNDPPKDQPTRVLEKRR